MIFVWRDDKVLKDYGSGLVVVEADSLEQAWGKLKAAHPQAYFNLQLGCSWAETEADAKVEQESMNPREGYPLQPEAFGPGELPVLVKQGSA